MTAEQRAELEALFDEIDADGDGFITFQELKYYFIDIGYDKSNKEINYFMERADTNGDGVIDLKEFIKAHSE